MTRFCLTNVHFCLNLVYFFRQSFADYWQGTGLERLGGPGEGFQVSIRRLAFSGFGNPSEVVEMEESPDPSPKPGQVIAETLCAPINPADLNYVEGVYGRRPELPAVPGMEGVVRIADPNGHERWMEGQFGIPINFTGTWQERFAIDADSLVPVPEGVAAEQLAMLKVNPPTAFLLLREFVDLSAGDWVVQNASNSVVGQCVIQLAKMRDIRTLNLVRDEAWIEPLTALGADAVLVDDENATGKAEEILGPSKARLALNTVGGDSALRLMTMLEPGGTHVTYGAMSRRSLKVPNRFLIFDDLQLRGFWVTRWAQQASPGEVLDLYGNLTEMMLSGELVLPVDKVYPVEEFREAITHAQQDKRKGKVLLRF